MIEIIPAIDIIGGKCVRLSQGDFSRPTVYSDDPVAVAEMFESAGLKRLHLVDLDGAKCGRISNLEVLEAIARNTDLKIDFGGGVKTMDDLIAIFDAGASMAAIGSVAGSEPDKFTEWLKHFGGDKFLLGADVKEGNVAINGWQTRTELEIVSFLSGHFARGVRQVFVTDIAKDGILDGPSIELYKRILQALPGLNLIASGGVSRLGDIVELEEIGCHGAIIGKAIYEGKIPLKDLAEYNGNVS